MVPKPLDKIEKADIDALIANQVRESRYIEYKAALPGNNDAERKEFLADASSFANTAGGDLIYGVAEANGVPTGVQSLAGVNLDQEMQRLENILQSGLDPRIPGARMRAIDGFPSGPVLLLRLPRSWRAPHMVTHGGTSRFYARNSNGKYQMDVTEIRAAFALSEELPQNLRRFRDDRLVKLIANQGQVGVVSDPQLVLHIIPFSAFTSGFILDPGTLRTVKPGFHPIANQWDTRFNVDGLLRIVSGRPADAIGYCQVLRNGIVESVSATIADDGRVPKSIPVAPLEVKIFKYVTLYMNSLNALEVPQPVMVFASLLRANASVLSVPSRYQDVRPVYIDRDIIVLPEILIDNLGIGELETARLLRPLFDAIWNAGGYERSMNFDKTGNWMVSQ